MVLASCSKEPICKNYAGKKAKVVLEDQTLIDTIGTHTYIIHCKCHYPFQGLLLKESDFEVIKNCNLDQ